jgi:hypothetical protein
MFDKHVHVQNPLQINIARPRAMTTAFEGRCSDCQITTAVVRFQTYDDGDDLAMVGDLWGVDLACPNCKRSLTPDSVVEREKDDSVHRVEWEKHVRAKAESELYYTLGTKKDARIAWGEHALAVAGHLTVVTLRFCGHCDVWQGTPIGRHPSRFTSMLLGLREMQPIELPATRCSCGGLDYPKAITLLDEVGAVVTVWLVSRLDSSTERCAIIKSAPVAIH